MPCRLLPHTWLWRWALVCCFSVGPAAADPVRLADLSDAQRTELFVQIERYGLVTAYLNFCQRPPNLVAKLMPIVQGCIEEASIATIRDRYTYAVVISSGLYNCEGRDPNMIARFERTLASLISNVRTACRLRSFYNLPTIDLRSLTFTPKN
jgi:hypothetical protein